MKSGTRERRRAATPAAATNRYDAPRARTQQATTAHRHDQGPDVDDTGWSTCRICGYLHHPTIRVLDGARARRAVRAS